MLSMPMVTALAACRSPVDGDARPREQISMIFFTEDSATMGEEARAAVAKAAAKVRALPGVPVVVRGLATPDGSIGFHRALSEARARNVAGRLDDRGRRARPHPLAPRDSVPFEAMPVESRRVEIRVGE